MPEAHDPLASWVLAHVEMGKEERALFETLWEEIARLVIPREATYQQEVVPGEERTRNILDSTAPRSLELFASFLSTTAHNPATKWFRTKISKRSQAQNRALVKRSAAKIQKWTDEVDELMREEMATSGLYSQLHKVELDLGAFGTGPLIIERVRNSNEVDVQYTHVPLQQLMVFENERGRIDKVIREVNWTAEQWRKKFPNTDLGPALEKILEDADPKKMKDKHRGYHMVCPVHPGLKIPGLNEDVQLEPWAHIWIVEDDAKTIEQSGSKRMKYAVPRWYTARGEAYGRSPAMTVMPEIRMANRMRDTLLRSAEKQTDPPLLLPDGHLVSPLRLFGGGVSFTDGEVNPQPLLPPGASNLVAGQEMLEDTRGAIREGFFVPLFITPESPVKTATQVLQEGDERNRAASPMIVRLREELMQIVVLDTFQILDEAGRLPPPPDGLEDLLLDVEYVSPIDAAQRQTEALGAVRLAESLAPWVELKGGDMSLLDKFDNDGVADVMFAGSGAPASLLADEDAVKRKRKERTDQQNAQAALENAAAGAQIAQSVSQATQAAA